MTDTSREAYQSVKPHLNDLQSLILSEVVSSGAFGCTPFEAIERTSILDYTVRPRFTELKQRGLIADSGRRRRNIRGRNEVVFVFAA